ncbi:MAG: D-alanyl-D-alanine carboxypeptidase [Bacteroidota bacterium]
MSNKAFSQCSSIFSHMLLRGSHAALFAIIILLNIFGCQSYKSLQVNRSIKKSPILSRHFVGLCLYNPEIHQFLIERNADLNFTPASNMKILTAFTSFETFGDSIPTFRYAVLDDTVVVQPLGDPTFLHPVFKTQPAYNFISTKKKLSIYQNGYHLDEFGPGWAWDDFQYDFQPERAWFPIYGNMVRVVKESDSVKVIPDFFKDYVHIQYGEKPGNYASRDVKYNLFNVSINNENEDFAREIPFDYDNELLLQLLADTLHMEVTTRDSSDLSFDKILYNQSKLDILSYMMQNSDNFLAEQLLIEAALINGFEDVDAFRQKKLEEWSIFNKLPIQWHDGSGLSRYNLITPLSLVKILEQIYLSQDWNTIKRVFPTGGKTGTIKNWYGGDPPFVYAKTGTLSNNHCLSGYLVTDSGKTLIFSFMNNNYVSNLNKIKEEMDMILRRIRKIY